MLYHRDGYPEEDELVLCTVTNVQYNSVFCALDEYGKSGMIHISEVSPGRIRNIRDYVQEGKKVVCKILTINKDRGHIDLSLRRVTENQRRAKLLEIKQELKAEKLIEHYATQELKQPLEKVYTEIAQPVQQHYEYLHQAFQGVVAGEADLVKLGVPKVYAQRLTEIIKEKIPPKSVSIKGVFAISTYAEDGVDLVKQALAAACETDAKAVEITNLGNGKYRVNVTADDYEQAEARIKRCVDAATAVIMSKPTGKIVFERAD